MNTSEKLKEIWKSKSTPLYFVGEKAETREQLITDIAKKVMSLVRVPVDGKTPTEKEVLAVVNRVMPTEKDLLNLIKPLIPKTRDGIDGKTPTEKELRALIEPLIPKVKNGEDGKTPDEETLKSLIRPIVLTYMEGVPKDTKPTYDEIKGVAEPIIRQMITEARKGWFGGGGGGDNVRAGTGVTITTNNVGAKVISATAGSLTELEATGDVDDTNVTFTFTEKPKYIIKNGQQLRETAGWTWSGLTATLSSPVGENGDIFGII